MQTENRTRVPKADANDEESVLIALLGKSPAVLSETVWELVHGEEPVIPSRIVVITTSEGRERLLQAFFSDRQWETFKNHLEVVTGLDLHDTLRFGPVPEAIRVIPSADFRSELADISSPADNNAVANFLLECVRTFAENEQIRIIASIAGGRKTMSALLHSVISLLGRSSDRITHVLVSDPWDRLPGFLYPGCPGEFHHPDSGDPLDSSEARVFLADLPFVPLRYLFPREIRSSSRTFVHLVSSLRARAGAIETELLLTLLPTRGVFFVNHREFRPSALEFAFYFAFAQRAANGEPPVATYQDIEDDLLEVARAWFAPEDFSHWSHRVEETKIDLNEDARRWASRLRKSLRDAAFDSIQVARLVPCRERLSIELPPERIQIRD